MVKISLNPQTNLQESPELSQGIKIELGNSAYAGTDVADYSLYDSMNFTNIYSDDISKYQKYGVPTTRYFNWDEERAQNQGTGEKWVNGLAKAGVTTIGAIAENTIGVLFGLGELATGGAYYDNFIGKSIDKWNESMREVMPNYRTEAEKEMSTGRKLLTANFWADTVANGFGYSIGSLATMWLTGGVGLVARGAKAMQMYNISKNVANGVKVAKGLEKGNRMTGITNTLAMGEMGIYMSLAESSVEARETQRNVYESLIQAVIEDPDNGINDISQLSDKDLKDIENASYAAGNRNFLMQLPVLAGTNLIMFGKSVAGFKPASRVNKDIAFDAALGKTVSTVGERGIFRNTLSRLKPTGRGAVTEAGQEGWQFASNIMSSDYHTDKYFDGGTASLTSSLYKGIKETLGSQEGLEAMLVGSIVGGGMSGVSSTIRGDYKQRVESAKIVSDVINGGFMENANNKMLNFNAQAKVALEMENARKAGNIKAFKDAQYKLIQYNAFAALENGTYDVFMQKLEDSKNLSDVEFAKAFGYNTDISIKEQTNGKSKSEVIKNVQDKLKDFKKVYNNVNEIFPSIPKSMGLPRMLMSEANRKAEDAVTNKRNNLRAELILSASGIENRTERLKNIQKNMKTVIQGAEDLNGIKLDTDVDLLLNPGEDLLFDEDGKYDPLKEVDLINKAFVNIQKELAKKNALAAIAPFTELANDYLSLFMDNSVAIDRYNKLSSSQYFQDLFEETVKANQAEAEQANKEKQTKEDIDSAETSDQVKESVPPDASSNSKMEGKIKAKALKKDEQEALKKYLDLHRDKSIKEQIKSLQHIAATNKQLSPTERKGLEVAIKSLELKLKKNKKATKSDIVDENVGEEITMTEDNIVRAENNDNINKDTPQKRPVRKRTKTSDDKRRTQPKPTEAGQLNVVSATNANEVINIGTETDPNYKVPVDENGNIIEPDPDTVTGIETIDNSYKGVFGTFGNIKVLTDTAVSAAKRGAKSQKGIDPNTLTYEEAQKQFDAMLEFIESRIRMNEILREKGKPIISAQRIIDEVYQAHIRLGTPGSILQHIVWSESESLKNYIRNRVNQGVVQETPGSNPIVLQPDLLLSEDILDEVVEFEIIENDWWKSGEFRDPSFTEDWMHIPIYYKIGNAYIGKLEASTSEDRKAIVDKLQKGEKVVTVISEIKSNNFNNTVDETTAPYFHNPEDTFGKENDILLAFPSMVREEEQVTYQWTLSEVNDEKNKNNELDMIKVEVQKDMPPATINQIGIVIKKENNPAGVSRISIATTARLNSTAQLAVLEALTNKDYSRASQIVANSSQRLSANINDKYLEFAEFEDGTQYIVYHSPSLGKLIRINENELKKALDGTGPSSFHIVTEKDERFEGSRSDTVKSNINIAEDLAAFLETKKYHVDRMMGNSLGEYTSPVNPENTYPSYQHYLFASKELGNEPREEGSGHNSILSTDITKKGESMFNSPRVIFEKGNVLGETAPEIINNAKIAETSPEAPAAPVAKKKKFKRGSKSKGIVDNLGKNKCD